MVEARRPMTMADFASSITDLGEQQASVNILLYGDPGTGKSCLLGGLPNLLYLACDPGWLAAKAIGHRPAFRLIDNYETLAAGISWLEDGGYSNYDWVLLDGGTPLQQKLLLQFSREAYDVNPAKRVSADQPDKPDYFRSQNVLKSSIARLMDLPVNVVLTFHAMHGETSDGEAWIRPHIEGRDYQVGNQITALPNCIGYMYPSVVVEGTGKNAVRRSVRRVRWQTAIHPDTEAVILAKDQTQRFGQVTDDLTAQQLHELVSFGSGKVTANGARPARTRTR